MAKEKKDDKARVRVFFAEFEGDNQTIRDGLRSIAEAVNRTFQPETRVVQRITPGNVADKGRLLTEPEEQVIELDAEDDEDEDFEADKPKAKSARNRKPPSHSFVKDMNFRPEGKQSLREFYREKNPSDQQQTLTVILFYLQHTLGIEKVGFNHLFTGVKELSDFGVRTPPDIPATVRNIANRKNWIDSSNSDALKMTETGNNFVKHDLPPTKGKKAQD